MTQETYESRRAELVKEFWFLKSKRLYLSARARVIKIAKLDLEQNGTPIEVTKEKFKYDTIKIK